MTLHVSEEKHAIKTIEIIFKKWEKIGLESVITMENARNSSYYSVICRDDITVPCSCSLVNQSHHQNTAIQDVYL